MSPLLPLPFVRTINSANLRGTSNVCRSFTSSLPRVPSPKALYIWNGVCRKRPRKPPGREEMISFGRKCGSQGGGKAIARNKCVMNLGAHGWKKCAQERTPKHITKRRAQETGKTTVTSLTSGCCSVYTPNRLVSKLMSRKTLARESRTGQKFGCRVRMKVRRARNQSEPREDSGGKTNKRGDNRRKERV